MYKRFCDRCKKEIGRAVIVQFQIDSQYTFTFDYCADCIEEIAKLVSWFDQEKLNRMIHTLNNWTE